MCGIAAILRLDGGTVDQPVLERMTASLVHRGPDEGRVYDVFTGLFSSKRTL